MDKRLLKNLDWQLLCYVFLLAGCGLVVISSATQVRWDDPSTFTFVLRQARWLAVGLIAMAVVLAFDYHLLTRWTPFLYALNIGLLLAVKAFGREALGAQRWLQIGPVDIQPSEFSKLLLIVTLAHYLARKEGNMRGWRDMAIPFAHAGLPMLLVLMQPDLGTSLVFVAITFGMLYIAGVPGRRLLALCLGGLAAAVAYIGAHFRFGIPIPLKDYQLKRLIVFTDPESDPLGAGYHIIQSEIAIGSGRLTGQGLYAGTQNQLNYLPEQHTDFIFSVIGEELGFLGGAAVILLFYLLLRRGLLAIAQARDLYGSLLAAGVVSMISFHVLVNIGMTMGLMPVTGVPLPFVSYGGSALLTNSVAIALVLNVRMRRQKILF